MPRLTHAVSGVTVEVSDETAELLGAEWVAEKAPAKRKSAADSKASE
jgi:hypothetical protein